MRWRAGWVLSLLAVAAPAEAGNDDEILVGNDAAVMGGAVTAFVADGSAAWYNPAGLAGVAVDTLNVSGSAFVLRNHRTPALLATSSGLQEPGNVLELVSVPSALTYVRPLSDTVRAAFAVFVTRASDLSLDAELEFDQISEDVPVPGRTLLALDYSETVYHLALSFGWRATERVWLGFGLLGTLQQIDASTLYSGGSEAPGLELAALFNQSDLAKSTVFGVLMNAGIQWQLTDALRLGVAVQSPSYAVYSSFNAPSVRTGLLSTPDRQDFGFFARRFEGSGFGFDQYLPPRLRAGLSYQHGKTTIAVDADVQPKFEDQRDLVWNARAGAYYGFSEDFGLGLGVFTDRSSTPEINGFGARDVDFYGVTVGGNYVTILDLASKESGRVTFATTVALRYAYGTGEIGGLLIPDVGDDISNVQSAPTKLRTHEIGLHLGSAVLF